MSNRKEKDDNGIILASFANNHRPVTFADIGALAHMRAITNNNQNSEYELEVIM